MHCLAPLSEKQKFKLDFCSTDKKNDDMSVVDRLL